MSNNQTVTKPGGGEQKKGQQEENIVWNVKTLPREILKWIQGLDLSYSVRDPRRDLNNGFLVAEIFSRYYPGKIQMHSFDNSQNFSRRKNNWELLDLFFSKNEIPLTKNDWKDVLLDNNAESLIQILIKIYQFLTQRKVSKPPLANYVNSKDNFGGTTISAENQTTSFLLKDKGLEKLEEKKDEKQEDDKRKLDGSIAQSENKAHLTNASSKRTNFLRVPSKPISQNIDNVNFQIDVKNLNVRQVTGSILKLRENKLLNNEENPFSLERGSNLASGTIVRQSQQGHTGGNTIESNPRQSAGQTENKDNLQGSSKGYGKKEKIDSIIDFMNNMIQDLLSEFPEEMRKFKVKNQSLVQVFVDSIDQFDEKFVNQFFSDILTQVDTYVTFVCKDPNELWKFMGFLFTSLFNLGPEKDSLVSLLYQLTHEFAQKSMYKDPNKVKHIFLEFYLEKFAEQIKSCLLFSKKEYLIQLLYSFSVPTPQARHQMISSFKDQVNDSHAFMQTLVVLIKYEKQYNENNQQLIQNFLHYATLHLFSSSANLRTMSLAIFAHITQLNYEEVMRVITPKIKQIQKYQWWENKCLAVIVFSQIIKGIISSEKYNNLVLNPQANQKFFNIETEKQVNEMKEQIEVFANGIKQLSLPISSGMVLQTTFIQIVDLLGESKTLIELFLHLIIQCNDELRMWVLHSQDGEIENKSDQQPAKGDVISLNYGNLNKNGQQQSQNENINVEDPKSVNSDNFVYYINSDKSLKYRSNINSQIIKKYASKILILLIDLIKSLEDTDFKITYEYLDIIVFCFENTDFKIINMEQCELIANTVKQYIFMALCEETMCQSARVVIQKILELMFFSDVKLSDVTNLFSTSICLIQKNGIPAVQQNLEEILKELTQEGYDSGIEQIKIFLYDTLKNIKQKNGEQFLKGSKIIKILEPVYEHFDRIERQNSLDQNGAKQENSGNQKQIENEAEHQIEVDNLNQQEEIHLNEENQEGEFQEEISEIKAQQSFQKEIEEEDEEE